MLELKNITKVYNNNTKAINDVSLSFRNKEFVCVIGPSGCGKTTLLNIIGGLDTYTNGDLRINSRTTKHYKEKDWDNYRNKSIGFVFQNYNLIPHLTVYENIEMALILSKHKKINRKQIVEQVLEQVSLTEVAKSYPNQLSGGQMQRVAIARAIVNNPDIVLADEPTGSLDSKTATKIVELLKEISKNKLVIMVTHNEQLSKQYATREIRLHDGKVISDSNEYITKKCGVKEESEKRTSINIISAVKLSAKSLYTKKIRTLLIVIAGSVGIIGVTLILTISNGVDKYISELQRITLADAPIVVNTTYDYDDPNEQDKEYEEFPEDNKVNIVTDRTYFSHLNIFSDGFLNYVNDINPNLYNLIDYRRTVNMNIYTYFEGNRTKISMTNFQEMFNDDFAIDQYEILEGKLPEQKNELVLLIDKYNNVNIQVLDNLGIEYAEKSSYQFNELIGKKYYLMLNNDYYKNYNGLYENASINSIDEEKTIPLEIVGIARIATDAKLSLYSAGILYSEELVNFVVEEARKSNVVTEQLANGIHKNVFTGEPFSDVEYPGTKFTKEYLYESNLVSIGYKARVTIIRIYTDKFNSRVLINEYLQKYNEVVPKENQIRYSDYYGKIIEEFDVFVEVLTKVLIIFALVSLFVSSIMISIITYVSVMERNKEIGILRSLGASKIDILNVFNSETAIIGVFSGVFGVIVSFIMMNPILNLITRVLKNNNIKTFDLTKMNISNANPFFIIAIIIGSILLTVIAGIIPSVIGANKSPVDAIRNG